MSLNNQNSPENLEGQESKPKIVMKYDTATIDQYGNIDGQPILQNCNATVNKNRLERYRNTEGNSGIITSEVIKNANLIIDVQEFNPKTGSIKCIVDGIDFSGSVEPIYTDRKGEKRFAGFKISAKSDFIEVGSIVKKGLRKVKVTKENISNFQRNFYFDSMTFHTDDVELGVLEDDSFVNLYSIDESNSPANNTSIYKLAFAAILGAGITYGAQNISTESIKDFTTHTSDVVNNTLNSQNTSIYLEVKFYDVKPGDNAISMLNNFGISIYNKKKVDKISLKKDDKLTIEYRGDELVSINSKMDGTIYE